MNTTKPKRESLTGYFYILTGDLHLELRGRGHFSVSPPFRLTDQMAILRGQVYAKIHDIDSEDAGPRPQ